MVSSVSFRSTPTMDFSERIKQPQTFAIKEEPSAATSIKKGKKKSSFGKKLFKLVLGAAAVACALALAAKSGKFVVPEGATGTLNAIKSGINTAGNAIIDKVSRFIPAATEEAATEAFRASV